MKTKHQSEARVGAWRKLLAIATFATCAVSHAAGWDTSSFPNLAKPSPDYSYSAMASDSGGTYVAMSTPLNGGAGVIHKWNASSGWSQTPIGQVSGGTITAMLSIGGSLYVAGTFDTAGVSTSAKGIAQLNFHLGTWTAVGTSVNGVDQGVGRGTVRKMVYDTGILYVGGHFDKIGGVAVGNISSWNGSSWSAMGGGVTTPAGYYWPGVHDIAVRTTHPENWPHPRSQVVAVGNYTIGSSHDLSYFDSYSSQWVVFGTGLRAGANIECSPCTYVNTGDYIFYSDSVEILSGKAMIFGDYMGIDSTLYPGMPGSTLCNSCYMPHGFGWDSSLNLTSSALSKWDHSGKEVRGKTSKYGSSIYAIALNSNNTSTLEMISNTGVLVQLNANPPVVFPTQAEANYMGAFFSDGSTLSRWVF